MANIKLTINLSEQVLEDLLDCLSLGIEYLNPEYYRYKHIMNLYDRISKAEDSNKEKISFRYKTVERPIY